MGWIIKEHKRKSNQQEMQMIIRLKEIAKISLSSTAETFIDDFKRELQSIKRTNIFSAEHAYKMTPRNPTSVEVWKMKVNGDYDYKMFTLEYDGISYNPFNF